MTAEPLDIFLAGEGPNDIGSWAREQTYQAEAQFPGVLEALLRKVRAEGWRVIRGRKWSAVRAYRAGIHLDREGQIVRRLANDAREEGADVLVFARDADDSPNRAQVIREVIAAVEGPGLAIVGAVPTPAIEGWVLAVAGTARTESFSRARCAKELDALGIAAKSTQELVRQVEEAVLGQRATDAAELEHWLASAAIALGASQG